MAKETKAPSGIAITRSKEKLVIKWKQKDDYASQQMQYKLHTGSKKDAWKAISVGAGTTSKSLTIDRDKYHPNKNKGLNSITFRIRGKANNKSWSDWTKKVYDILVPNKPSVSVAQDSTLPNKVTFSWALSTSDTDRKIYTKVQYQSVLTTGNASPNWKSASTTLSTQDQTSGTVSYTEDTSVIADGSHTRYFRIRSVGPQGASGWAENKFVHALPYQAANVEASVKETEEGGLNAVVTWTTKIDKAHPVAKTTVQYTMIVPDAGLECPSGASWNDANISKDIVDKGTDIATSKAVFSIDDALAKDQCLFVRVNTQHAEEENINYGEPVLAEGGVGQLKDPSDPVVSDIDTSTHRVTITAVNNSEVEDSVLAIIYRSKSEPDADFIIDTLPYNGSYTKTIQCPDWGDDVIGFGVYAVVGEVEEKTRADGVGSYAIDEKMRSANTIWAGGSVPQSPTGITASQTEIPGTIRVTWDWNWEEADSAVLSWADHIDAWESTDKPEEFTINKVHASQWNISGLETGKTWYIRVRLVKGTEDNLTYGPWSELVSVDLSSAPNIPTLVLSEDVITIDGTVTASWAYSSTDATAQAYAKICEVEIANEGLEYGDIIAHAQTAQHVDISAEVSGWQSGETHNLALMVMSASGRESNWSDPVSVTIAEPLTCEITETSLEEQMATVGGDIIEDNVPYNFRKVPEGVGDRVYDEIVGGTVAWNQHVRSVQTGLRGSITYTDGVATLSSPTSRYPYLNSNTFHSIKNHKYLCTADIKYTGTITSSIVMCLNNGANQWNGNVVLATDAENTWIRAERIFGPTVDEVSNSYVKFQYNDANYSNLASMSVKNTNCIDLTQMFGSTIADYIYSLEVGTAGAGVAFFKKLFPKPYYAYNAGQLMSVNASSHNTVGFNQLDPAKTKIGGAYNPTVGNTIDLDSTGATYAGTNPIEINVTTAWRGCCLISEPLVAGQQYEVAFKTSAPTTADKRISQYLIDADNRVITNPYNWVGNSGDNITRTFTPTESGLRCAVTIQSTSAQKITVTDPCVHLVWDGERNGEYEPYVKHEYALDSDLELRGIPKLDASNNLYYDGDTYESDGTVTRKYGIVDLGTLNWSYNSSSLLFYTGINDAVKSANTGLHGVCSKYRCVVGHNPTGGINDTTQDKVFSIGSSFIAVGNNLLIRDTAYTDPEQFKTAMSGVYLVYELATPTTETADTFTDSQQVSNWGTEEYVDTRNIPIPVGHNSKYAPEGGTIYKELALTELPMTVTVEGAGEGGTTTIAIERFENYHMTRPDETEFNGYEGETVFLKSQTGEEQMEITLDDLIGSLDDEASYQIVATAKDAYGQSASANLDFVVGWEHQAIIPTATVVIDDEEYIAKITVPQPTGAIAGDTFDIYRLSADKPEKIIEDGVWGTTYVDPYPALGDYGYRVCFKTLYGDYITVDKQPAWVDVEEGLVLEDIKTIIDFAGIQIPLTRNVDVGNSWEKAFEETRYLGGSVQGDWNVAIGRSGTVTTTAITIMDESIIADLRRLAMYPGICHIRTFDGSSFACDIQVSEDRDHDSYGTLAEFSFTITRIDPEEMDGLTLEEWEA